MSLEIQEEEAEFFVVVRVLDQGVGIDDTAEIFDAFAQEPHSISRTNSGGLGKF